MQFMHAMKAFLLSQPSGRTSAKLVEANELLYIAAETYQKSSGETAPAAGRLANDLQDTSTTHNLGYSEGEEDPEDEEERRTQSLQQQLSTAAAPRAPQPRHAARVSVSSQVAGKGKESAIGPATTTALAGERDVQTRLGSLLERMKQRQRHSSSQLD